MIIRATRGIFPNIFALGFLFIACDAWSARLARIDQDDTPLLSAPRRDAIEIEKLAKGVRVPVSNLPIEGYYKVKAPSGNVGFVSSEAIFLFDEKDRMAGTSRLNASPAATRKKEELPYRGRIGLLGGLGLFNSKDVGSLTGFGDIANGIHFGAEVHFYLARWIGVGVRTEYISKSVSAQDEATSDVYTLSFSSLPVMAGVLTTFGSGKPMSTAFHFGLYGGLGLSTRLVSTLKDAAAPNETVLSASPFMIFTKVELDFPLSNAISFFLEAGYRILKTGELVPSEVGNGSDLFQVGGEYQAVPISLSGVTLSAGITLLF